MILVAVDTSMKMLTHCVAALKTANSMLGIIGNRTKNKMVGTVIPTYRYTALPLAKTSPRVTTPLVSAQVSDQCPGPWVLKVTCTEINRL